VQLLFVCIIIVIFFQNAFKSTVNSRYSGHSRYQNLVSVIASVRNSWVSTMRGIRKARVDCSLFLVLTLLSSQHLGFMCYFFQMTMADIAVFNACNNYLSVVEGFPVLKAHHDRIANVPGIKAWLQKRPQTNLWVTISIWSSRSP